MIGTNGPLERKVQLSDPSTELHTFYIDGPVCNLINEALSFVANIARQNVVQVV